MLIMMHSLMLVPVALLCFKNNCFTFVCIGGLKKQLLMRMQMLTE